jgi:hypothetical protein
MRSADDEAIALRRRVENDAGLRGIAGAAYSRLDARVARQDGEAAFANGLGVRATGDHADLFAGRKEARRDAAADGAGAVNADVHGPTAP